MGRRISELVFAEEMEEDVVDNKISDAFKKITDVSSKLGYKAPHEIRNEKKDLESVIPKPGVVDKISDAFKDITAVSSKLGHKAPYEIRNGEKALESATPKSSVVNKISDAFKDITDVPSKLGHKAPHEIRNEEKALENATPLTESSDEKQVTMNAVVAANTVGLEMKPLMIMLDNEGGVVDEQTSEENQSLKIDNSAIIEIYPQLNEIEKIIHSYNLDVVFSDTPNTPGYIVAQVLKNGELNNSLSFTIDLKGYYISPDEKIFISNAKTVSPIAIPILNMQLFEDIIAGKHDDTNLDKFDLYVKEDREISKLINLATLPEKVGSINRNKVISNLLKDGFQTALANALEDNNQVYFVFTDYKSPNSFKLVSNISGRNFTITYNGKTATLTQS